MSVTPTVTISGAAERTSAGDLAAIDRVCKRARREGVDAAKGRGLTGDAVADAALADRRAASRLARIRVSSTDDETLQAAVTAIRDAADALELGADYATPEARAISLLQSIGATC